MTRDYRIEGLEGINISSASLYSDDTSAYDERDENYQSSEDEREYYCEVCDREFPSEPCLRRHMGEHRVCGIDGCVFSAHPKLVEKHIGMQHSTGLYHRMRNLSTPEDVEKWIMERKRRYPTRANVEHLIAEATEKKKRYEVIREKKSVRELKESNGEPRKTSKRRARKRPSALSAMTNTTATQLHGGVPAFAGTLSLREATSDAECSLIEDSDTEADVRCTEETLDADRMETTATRDKNNVTSPSLVADYGTDSDGDAEPEELPIEKSKAIDNYLESNPKASDRDQRHSNNRSRSRNGNNKNRPKGFAKAGRTDERHAQRFQVDRKENRNTRGGSHRTNKIQLLDKLLSRSIQRERNLISQCIKYIVDKNYFE